MSPFGLIPTIAEAFCHRASTWQDKNEFDKAIADYTEAIRLDPNDAGAFHDRGIIWEIRGTMTRPLPTSTRPFGLIRTTPRRLTTGAEPGNSRESSTTLWPTTPRPFGSTRRTRPRSITGATYG